MCLDENSIKQTKKELLDCIHNLMGVLDTPIGRKKFNDDFTNEARNIAREILKDNNINIYNI